MYTHLLAATNTLADFLRARLEADPQLGLFFDPGQGGNMVVSLSNPQELAQLEGVSVWLYRVVRDENRLNDPNVRLGPNETRRPPLPVRLHYLITPFVRNTNVNASETEQLVMGKIMQSLHDHPLFTGNELAGDLRDGNHEFSVRLETLTLEELTRVWAALERPYQLSISYEAAIVLIESERTTRVAPVVIAEPVPGVIVGEQP